MVTRSVAIFPGMTRLAKRREVYAEIPFLRLNNRTDSMEQGSTHITLLLRNHRPYNGVEIEQSPRVREAHMHGIIAETEVATGVSLM